MLSVCVKYFQVYLALCLYVDYIDLVNQASMK